MAVARRAGRASAERPAQWRRSGAAIEARLYAEDPRATICPASAASRICAGPPSAGLRLTRAWMRAMRCRVLRSHARQDHRLGHSRSEAADRLRRALGELELAGVTTNRALLAERARRPGVPWSAAGGDGFSRRRAAPARTSASPMPDLEDCVLAALWCATRHAAPGALWSEHAGLAARRWAVTRWRFGELGVPSRRARADEYRARMARRSWHCAGRARCRPACGSSVRPDERAHVRGRAGPQLELFRAGGHTCAASPRTPRIPCRSRGEPRRARWSLRFPAPWWRCTWHRSRRLRAERR